MNRRGYNRAVQELSDRLYRFLFFHIKDEAESQDIVQDTFVKLWENRKKVEEEKVTKWLFVTAHRQMIDFTRKQKLVFKSQEEFKRQDQTSTIGFETEDVVNQCLNSLSAIHKTIVILRDLEGYNYKEIGEITELSESQVKVYLFRARNKFRDAYHLLDQKAMSNEG